MLSSTPTDAVLNQLIHLNLAGELGFATAAEHVKNRAIKLYLKNYAQQRAGFVDELRAEVSRRSGKLTATLNPLAGLHRGWIDVKAALTIGRDNQARVVLQECLRGDRVILDAYQRAQQAALPAEVAELLQRHRTQIQQVYDQLCQMAEGQDDVLLVQLFERAESVQAVVARLAASGLPVEQIQTAPVAQISPALYHGKRQHLLEICSASALLGVAAGLLLGLLITLPVVLSGNASALPVGLPTAFLFSTLISAVGGILFGLLISRGVKEDDTYFYQTTLKSGGTIVAVQTDGGQSKEVRKVLYSQRDQERQLRPAVAV
jgi:uncharacterized protein (TIGR02284 family)